MNQALPSTFSDDAQPIRTTQFSIADFRIRNPRTRVIVSKRPTEWYDIVESKLGELVVDLRAGWDGYDAQPVALPNAIFALSMLNSVCRSDTLAPQIVPGTTGDLQIEWHTEHVDIELTVKNPNEVHAWRCLVSGDPDGESLDLTTDFTDVVNWIAAMSEQQIVANAAAA